MPTSDPPVNILSVIIHVAAISVQTFCISRRCFSLSPLSFARLCPFLAFCTAWVFTAILITVERGAGTRFNTDTCLSMQYVCLIFYLLYKGLVTCFLAERAYIAWNSIQVTNRFKSKVYCVAGVAILIYLALIVRIAIKDESGDSTLDADGNCIILAKNWLMIVVVACDIFITTVLTGLFVYPLVVFKVSGNLREMARRASIASAVAMAASSINIVVIGAFHKTELLWICMFACVIDLSICSSVLLWLTSGVGAHEKRLSQSQGVNITVSSPSIPSFRVPRNNRKHDKIETSSSTTWPHYDPEESGETYFGSDLGRKGSGKSGAIAVELCSVTPASSQGKVDAAFESLDRKTTLGDDPESRIQFV